MLKRVSFFLIFLILGVNLTYGGSLVRLNNGVKVVENYRDYNPTVSIVIMIKGGLFRESDENNGIGELALNSYILSSDIYKKLEELGGSISSHNSSDYSEISLSVPSKFIKTVLPYLEKLIKNIDIDENIFKNEKRITLERLNSLKDRPDEFAFKTFLKETYKRFIPYSLDVDGEVESVGKLTVEDCKRYLKKLFSGRNIIVSIAGYYTKTEREKLIKIFETIPKGEEIVFDCKGSEIDKSKRVELEHNSIRQAKLFIGYTAPKATSEDYLSMKVLSEVLGGGMSSIYFKVLRKEKGYAYSVGSFYPSRLCASRFVSYIGLNYENVDDAIKTFQSINHNLKGHISADEIKKAKNALVGRVLIEAQTNAKIAWYAAFFEMLGLGYDFFEKYIERLESVNYDDVIDVSQKYLNEPKTVFILKGKN